MRRANVKSSESFASLIGWLFCYDSSMKGQRGWVLIPLLGRLFGCAPASPPGSAAAAGTGAPDGSSNRRTGADLFNGNCAACHQQGGEGIPGVYPSLAGS